MLTKSWGRSALMIMAVASLWGCSHPKVITAEQQVEARYAQMDEFDVLLLRAGVDLMEFPAQEAWTVDQASDLVEWLHFKIYDGNQYAYGPRILASFLLAEELKLGKPVSRRALIERMKRHKHLAVLNPDGHLVSAYMGSTLLCVGALHIEDGIPQAGDFRVDAFYVPTGNGFQEEANLVAPAIFTHPAPRPPTPQKVADTQPK
ncbi:MAG: hypothetical protein ACJ8AT_04845 [Hyalangium sp.]|uniref:hypothetical protein n=1 Tax=Hyalangium sp. TaxID=2028555 RepID=UPI00389AF908